MKKLKELESLLLKADALCNNKELKAYRQPIKGLLLSVQKTQKVVKKASNQQAETAMEKWQLDLATGSLKPVDIQTAIAKMAQLDKMIEKITQDDLPPDISDIADKIIID